MSKYEINFEREILREKNVGILADFDRYLEDNNIDYDDTKNPIILLERAIRAFILGGQPGVGKSGLTAVLEGGE